MPAAFRTNLFHQVGHEWQHTQYTGAFDGSSHTALVFQAVACDPARQQFALLIDELKQKIGIFIVDVFDTEFAETAVFFAAQSNFRIAEKFYIFSGSSHIVLKIKALDKWLEIRHPGPPLLVRIHLRSQRQQRQQRLPPLCAF